MGTRDARIMELATELLEKVQENAGKPRKEVIVKYNVHLFGQRRTWAKTAKIDNDYGWTKMDRS
jgi:hypothetical protein